MSRSLAALIVAAVAVQFAHLAPHAQAPPPAPGTPVVGAFPPQFGAGPPSRGERKVVAQFDKNGDGRLDTVEREPAREWLRTQGGGQPFFGRGRFGGAGVTPTPGPRITPADVRPAGKAPLYDPATLRTLFLEFPDNQWEQALTDFYNTDVEIPATVIVDGATYRNVGVHARGMSSFMVAAGAGSKKSLNLTFDFVDGDQRLLGYRTLNLLNANGDPTLMRTVLYSHIARQYMAAPKANFMRVVINGEYWGVYVNVEQFNSDFVREHFGSAGGARWKVPGQPGGQGGMVYVGDDPQRYRQTYEIKSKDDAKSWAALIEVCRVLAQTPPEQLEAAIAPLLDVDGTLKFLALETVLVNSDGYWSRASDYSIYQDAKGRFHVIPHDFNETFSAGGGGRGGGGPFGGGGVTLDPLVGLDRPLMPLRSKLLAVPALRARYMEYVRDIATRWLDWTVIEPLIKQYDTLIVEAVKADTRKLATFDAYVAGVETLPGSLKGFVERRRAFLLDGQR